MANVSGLLIYSFYEKKEHSSYGWSFYVTWFTCFPNGASFIMIVVMKIRDHRETKSISYHTTTTTPSRSKDVLLDAWKIWTDQKHISVCFFFTRDQSVLFFMFEISPFLCRGFEEGGKRFSIFRYLTFFLPIFWYLILVTPISLPSPLKLFFYYMVWWLV